ncbi:MAG TPA: SAM-dependent methyltransferase, partial [Telluria sp.]|nr:SAM-dependent methyltransferase [Telluria sp.]
MDNAASDQSIIALDGWLQTPAGRYLCEWEQACLDNLTADIFGFNALQIGMPQINALAANRMPYQWLADNRVRPRSAGSQAAETLRQVAVALDYTELPFASQSIDLVVLPHVLEFSAEPH